MHLVNQIEKMEEVILRHVNLDQCEGADPCAYDHTCRIHKIRWFLKKGREAIGRGDSPDEKAGG